jgi:type II secretory pathway component PulJ
MAIIGAILAQGAIRFLDRQKREQRAAEKSISSVEQLQN